MANNKIQVKRTSTSGRTPNTTNSGNAQYIAAGELALNMADGILYSSNGSTLIEIGANNTNSKVTGTLTVNSISANGGVGTSGQVLKSNGSSTFWGTDSADVGAAGQILYRNSSNVLTTSSGLQYDGVSIKVNGNLESTYQNGDEGGEIFLSKPAPANTSIAGTGVTIDIFQNKLRFFENGGTNRGAYIDITSASAGVGSNLLTGGGGGTGTVTSVGSGNGLTGGPITGSGTISVLANNGIIANSTGVFVNQGYNYTWTGTQTFQANVAFTGNNITLPTNTGSVMFAGAGDTNWRIGRSTGAFTKRFYTNNTLDFIAANSNLEGIAFGYTASEVYLETGYNGTYTKNPVYVGTANSTSNGIAISTTSINIGNSTVNSTINSTSFTGSANNSSFLGGTAAASFVQNTDSRTLSGNLVISGTYFNPSANTILLGNSTQRWVLSATSGDFSSTVNAVTSVNSALLTVGASFVANTTGAYHTGTINASSITTTGVTVNAIGVYPTSNTSGQGLGAATQRFDAFLDVVDVSGTININAGANAIVLSNNTSQFIVFAGGGSAAPTNTTRSPGTKLVIWPAVGASSVDYGIGTDNYVQWYSVGQTIASHVWYANTTKFMTANISGLYHSGVINAASHTVGTSFTANSTVVNAVSYYAGTLLVANTTVVNATHLSGKTEGNLNVNTALTANNADYVKANNGIISNSFGVFVNGGPTTTVNTTGVHVNSTLSLQTLTTTGNVTIGGNLTVAGNVTVIGANNLSIVDNFIYLNSNNTTENIDIGFAGNYNDGTYKHTGFFRDATDGVWKVFDNYAPEPDANVNIDTSNTSFRLANFQANSLLLGNTSTNWVTANSTVINAVSYYVGTTLIGNSTGPYGKTEGNLNVNNALTANNSSFLGGVASASYVVNTDSRTLSGNLVFSGSNVAVTGKLAIVGGLIANGSLGTANQVLSTNGTSVYWANSGGGGSSNLSTQNTNPSAPPSGQLYWNNDLGKIIIYYQDGSSNQWVEASGIAGPKGDTGDRGFTGTMTIGTVVVGANATDAKVNNSGNSTASILNFTLPIGGVQSITAGNGINGGTITTTGTISIRANTGLVSNSTGVHVNTGLVATTGKAIAMAIVFG